MIDPKVFKQVRKALGLSQQELADALGLSRVTVNKMERGRLRRGIPDEIAHRLMELKPFAVSNIIPPWRNLAKPNPFEDAARGRDPVKVNDDAHLWDNEEDDQ